MPPRPRWRVPSATAARPQLQLHRSVTSLGPNAWRDPPAGLSTGPLAALDPPADSGLLVLQGLGDPTLVAQSQGALGVTGLGPALDRITHVCLRLSLRPSCLAALRAVGAHGDGRIAC